MAGPQPGAAQPPESTPVPRDVIRSWDRRATEEYGIPSLLLMENAALGSALLLVVQSAMDPLGFPPRANIICGPGNNGGDGLAIARHLHNRSWEVTVHLVEPREKIDPASDAGVHLRIAERMRLDVREPGREPGPGRPLEKAIADATREGVVIDAMLGTGLTRPLKSPYLEWVEGVNRSGRPVVAIDIPTGLDADTGRVLGAAIVARHTYTMASPKLGFTLADGPRHTGQVWVVDIGLPRALKGA